MHGDYEPDLLKDFLQKMICFDPDKRLTTQELLQHEYLVDVPPPVVSESLQEEDGQEISSEAT